MHPLQCWFVNLEIDCVLKWESCDKPWNYHLYLLVQLGIGVVHLNEVLQVCLYWRESESESVPRWVHRESNLMFTLNSDKIKGKKIAFQFTFAQCKWNSKLLQTSDRFTYWTAHLCWTWTLPTLLPVKRSTLVFRKLVYLADHWNTLFPYSASII